MARTLCRYSQRTLTLRFTTRPVTSCRESRYCIRVFRSFTVKPEWVIISCSLSPGTQTCESPSDGCAMSTGNSGLFVEKVRSSA